MVKLATWNVNSLKVRLEQVLAWLDAHAIDILALQETKLSDDNFPVEAFKERGFHVSYSGQRTYNGVAVISRSPCINVETDMPHFPDPQRRILAATLYDIRLINLYVPNGSHVGSEKYEYKLNWLQAMQHYLASQLQTYEKLAVVGDFNIAPANQDVYDPRNWENSVLFSEPEKQAFQQILNLGLQDSFRCMNPDVQAFTWWDYRAAAFRRNMGLRIDHILLTPVLAKHCVRVMIDKEPRKVERPSDHAPVVAEWDLI